MWISEIIFGRCNPLPLFFCRCAGVSPAASVLVRAYTLQGLSPSLYLFFSFLFFSVFCVPSAERAGVFAYNIIPMVSKPFTAGERPPRERENALLVDARVDCECEAVVATTALLSGHVAAFFPPGK